MNFLMTQPPSLPLNNRSLFLLAGVCSFLAMAANLADVVLGFGSSEVVTFGTKSAAEWIAMFQQGSFGGLYALGILNIVYMFSMLPIYVAMVFVHRQTHLASSCVALVLAMLSVGIYVSGNAAVPMMVLAQRHAVAIDPTQRQVIEAAAQAILARGEDFTPGAFFGLFASGLAAIVMAAIMFRGGVFSKTTGVVGLVGFSFLTLFTIIATFIPAWYMFAFSFLGSIGGLLALTWFALTGAKFLRLKNA